MFEVLSVCSTSLSRKPIIVEQVNKMALPSRCRARYTSNFIFVNMPSYVVCCMSQTLGWLCLRLATKASPKDVHKGLQVVQKSKSRRSMRCDTSTSSWFRVWDLFFGGVLESVFLACLWKFLRSFKDCKHIQEKKLSWNSRMVTVNYVVLRNVQW